MSRKSPRPGNVQGNANPDSRKARRAAPLKRKKPANYTQRIAVFGRFATTSSLETRSGGGGTGAPARQSTPRRDRNLQAGDDLVAGGDQVTQGRVDLGVAAVSYTHLTLPTTPYV